MLATVVTGGVAMPVSSLAARPGDLAWHALADAAFNLWLLDRHPRWREIGGRHYLAMKRWNKASYGYTDMADVTADPKTKADHCPGSW